MKFTTHLTTLVFLLASAHAFGSTGSECKAKLKTARQSLVDFTDGKGDESKVNSTADDVEACYKAVLGVKDVASLNSTWTTFKDIRNNKIIPAIKANKKDEAKALAGQNKVNYEKMMNILGAD